MTVTVLSPGHAQLENLAANWLDGLLELHPESTKDEFLAGAPPAPIEDLKTFDVEALANRKTPVDRSVANGSSIALLLEYGGSAVLLTGDAYPQVVASSIRELMKQRGKAGSKLRLDAFKLAHHGSKNGISKELLDTIDCSTYLISTNGARFYHPDQEAIAKVIMYGGRNPKLSFNYLSDFNKMWGEDYLMRKYGYCTEYPSPVNPGLRIALMTNGRKSNNSRSRQELSRAK